MNYFTTPPYAPDQSYELSNLTLACSVSSGALTISLKTKAANDPSSGDAVGVGFRSETSATGTYSKVFSTSATSLTLAAASTLGAASGVQHYPYVYVLNNAGTLELAASLSLFDEGSRQSTTAEGGGSATSNRVLYSTTARSNVPIRLVGRLTATQTGGLWATPTEISLKPFLPQVVAARYTTSSTGAVPNSATVLNFSTRSIDTHNAVAAGVGWVFTCPLAGLYEVDSRVQVSGSAINSFNTTIRKNGSSYEAFGIPQEVAASFARECQHKSLISCAAGDTIDVQFWESVDNATLGGNATVSIKRMWGIS